MGNNLCSSENSQIALTGDTLTSKLKPMNSEDNLDFGNTDA